ncbi:MAG TPA: hypothetical protein VF463_08495 [Sphingobium sp.]
MATSSAADFAVTGEWQNVLLTLPALIGVDGMMQDKIESAPLYVCFDGAQPTDATAGARMALAEREYFNCATALWVRTDAARGGKIALWSL